LWGAVFLYMIAVLPFLVQIFGGVGNIMIGGTSLLIVAGVAIEIKNQIEAQIVTRSYERI